MGPTHSAVDVESLYGPRLSAPQTTEMAQAPRSAHAPSQVPRLYQTLQQDYIERTLSAEHCFMRAESMSAATLFARINYPALQTLEGPDLDAVLLIAPTQSLSDSSLNHIIARWPPRAQTQPLEAIAADPDLWIKYPRSADRASQEQAVVDVFVGLTMNKLRRRLPNFAFTLGALKCQSKAPGHEGPPPRFCAINQPAVLHVIQERVPGLTLEAWLHRAPEPRAFLRILLQVALALAKAQEKRGFVHHALFASNIILRPADLGPVTYQLGDQNYTINPAGLVPTIIDYGSARIAKRGMAVCYRTNPTFFTPGQDLAQLIGSCLALAIGTPFRRNIAWLQEWLGDTWDFTTGSYPEMVARTDGFLLAPEDPKASLSALDFIHWVRGRHGELFNALVSTQTRSLKPLDAECTAEPDLASLTSLPSGSLKAFILRACGKPYTPSATEEEYDDQMLAQYRGYLAAHPTRVYRVNYNFPLARQYDGDHLVDYRQVLAQQEADYDTVTNYILFLRVRRALGHATRDEPPFEVKWRLKHNLAVIRNLPFYRIYLATQRDPRRPSGETLVALSDFDQASAWAKQLVPLCAPVLDRVLAPAVRFSLRPYEQLRTPLYYPPSTLQQFQRLRDLGLPASPRHGTDMEVLLHMRETGSAGGSAHLSPSQQAAAILALVKIRGSTIRSLLVLGDGASASLASALGSALTLDPAHVKSLDVTRSSEAGLGHASLRAPDDGVDLVVAHQALYRVENPLSLLNHLRHVCRSLFVLVESDADDPGQRMTLDVQHSMREAQTLSTVDQLTKYLNDYRAWHRSTREWTRLAVSSRFRLLHLDPASGPLREFTTVFGPASS